MAANLDGTLCRGDRHRSEHRLWRRGPQKSPPWAGWGSWLFCGWPGTGVAPRCPPILGSGDHAGFSRRAVTPQGPSRAMRRPQRDIIQTRAGCSSVRKWVTKGQVLAKGEGAGWGKTVIQISGFFLRPLVFLN